MRHRTAVICVIVVLGLLGYLTLVKRSQYTVPQPMFSSQQNEAQANTNTGNIPKANDHQPIIYQQKHDAPTKTVDADAQKNGAQVESSLIPTETSSSPSSSSSSSHTLRNNKLNTSPRDSSSSNGRQGSSPTNDRTASSKGSTQSSVTNDKSGTNASSTKSSGTTTSEMSNRTNSISTKETTNGDGKDNSKDTSNNVDNQQDSKTENVVQTVLQNEDSAGKETSLEKDNNNIDGDNSPNVKNMEQDSTKNDDDSAIENNESANDNKDEQDSRNDDDDGNDKPNDPNDKPNDEIDKPNDENDKPNDDKANDGNDKPNDEIDKPNDENDKPNENAPDTTQKMPQTTTPAMSLEDRFKNTLRKTANADGLIYMSSVDYAYLPMAINLYKTSYKRLNITNYLIVCSDDKADQVLKSYSINSFKYLEDKSSDTPVIYGTKEFRRKTHLKTKIILDALLLGLTVIIVDVDIIFFKDPVPFLSCQDCDIQIQSDVVEGNSGFYMARPTDPAIKLHQSAWDKAQVSGESISNQKLLDRAMESLQRSGQIKYRTLDANLFPSGKVYFEDKVRMFYTDNPPREEVILHNNWIVSMEAKRYRFKELLWWHVDSGYYSDLARKYLTYENPRDFGMASTQRQETDALISALIVSHILGRTLILPSFTCHNCKYGACKVSSQKCTFNTHYMIATFDAVMGENYREHVFLESPLVPELYKSPSTVHAIQSPDSAIFPSGVKLLVPADVTAGPSVEEIINWFGASPDPVLRFHSMYGILGKLRTHEIYSNIKKALNEHTDYRQYNL